LRVWGQYDDVGGRHIASDGWITTATIIINAGKDWRQGRKAPRRFGDAGLQQEATQCGGSVAFRILAELG